MDCVFAAKCRAKKKEGKINTDGTISELQVTNLFLSRATGEVLSQKEHPVIYVSRKSSQAEQNYSNIEREAIAIVFEVTRLKQFLLELRFTLQTDLKHLKYLFAPDKEIPQTASIRITRRAVVMMGFGFQLKYTPREPIPTLMR